MNVNIDNRPVKINSFEIPKQLTVANVELVFFTIYVIAYIQLPQSLKHEPFSKWFLAHVIFMCFRVLNYLYSVATVMKYYDRVVSVDGLRKRLKKNIIANLVHLGYIITSEHILNNFICVTKNDIYANEYLADISIKIIAVKLIVMMGILVFSVLFTFIHCYCSDKNVVHIHRSHPRYGENIQDLKINHDFADIKSSLIDHSITIRDEIHDEIRDEIRDEIHDMRPIIFVRSNKISAIMSFAAFLFVPIEPDLIDIKCSECDVYFEMTDKWTSLPCKHTYHFNCIHNWLSMGHISCPVCNGFVGNYTIIINILRASLGI